MISKDEIEQIREKLLADRVRLLESAKGTLSTMNEPNPDDLNDEVDHATLEQHETVDLRLRDREAGLLTKIDETLRRIDADSDEFGFCGNCGGEIGFKRLLARPVATLCIRCKEEQEGLERGYADA